MAQDAELVNKWLDRAKAFTKVAEEATAAGNQVVMIVALQRAAECIQLAKIWAGPNDE